MKKITQVAKRFHNDNRGSNSLEQIVIFALGVLVLGGVYFMWEKASIGGGSGVKGGLTGLIDTLFSFDFGAGKGGKSE